MIRKKYSSALKAKVALEAVRGDDTISTIASKYQVHPNCVSNWKSEFLEKLPGLFEKGYGVAEVNDNELIALERKVGQLTIENDFLKKNWLASSKKKGGK